jgi:hypothetical protein
MGSTDAPLSLKIRDISVGEAIADVHSALPSHTLKPLVRISTVL